jgi:hypothetical protein
MRHHRTEASPTGPHATAATSSDELKQQLAALKERTLRLERIIQAGTESPTIIDVSEKLLEVLADCAGAKVAVERS